MPQMIGIEQESPEWIVARVGCVTASRMADLMTKRKDGKEAAPRYNYRMELVIENLTGRAADHYVSPAMEWGLETQKEARGAYEVEKGVDLAPGGLWIHDKLPRFAASPDYLLGTDGLVETKCPMSATHLEYLIAGEIPEDYQWQMLAQMACTGRQYCDFVSFDPRLPEDLQLFVKRFPRDEGLIAAMELEVRQFLQEVDEFIEKVRQARGIKTKRQSGPDFSGELISEEDVAEFLR